MAAALPDLAAPRDATIESVAPVLRPMREEDLAVAIALASRALPPEQAASARRCFEFHFACEAGGIDDGRRHYLLATDDTPLAFAGLHRAPWGPSRNAWLSWLAVDPARRGEGIGARLVVAMMDEARALGHDRMLIETYAGDAYASARRLYLSLGFERVGGVRGYLREGLAEEDMLVFARGLRPTA